MKVWTAAAYDLMQANPLLSITIPTHNRADFLDRCLEIHIPLAKAHNIQIFISDNASTDATEEVVRKRMAEYPLIRYHRNEINIGPDSNFELALKSPKTEYVWFLGDTYEIPSEGLGYILDLISKAGKKHDVIIVNAEDRVSGIAERDYSDQNQLLSDLGWHMTCISSLIISSRLIAGGDFPRYRNTNFIQTGVIFDYIANKDFLVHWIENISVRGISLQGFTKVSWESQTFEIWARRWANFIFSLPASYAPEIKLKCIQDHGEKAGVFKIRRLLYLRGVNLLNLKTYRQYSGLFPIAIKCPGFLILFIALLPRSPFLLLHKLYMAFR